MEINNIWIGIDPGSLSGAMCVISEDVVYRTTVDTYEFNDMTEKDINDVFVHCVAACKNCKAVVEDVHSMPKQGVVSVSTFADHTGCVRGMMIAHQIPFEKVSPMKWMKWYGMKKDKEESKDAWKKRLRQKAEQLFPSVKIVKNTADAVLIAKYCKDV
jgi:crossover junction endodeoxyribonuclease RuvC